MHLLKAENSEVRSHIKIRGQLEQKTGSCYTGSGYTKLITDGLIMHDQSVRRDTRRSCFAVTPNRNDLYYRMKVILVVFKLIGLAPLSIGGASVENKLKGGKSKSVWSAQFAYSRIGNLYNVFLVVILLGISSVSLPLLYGVDYPFRTKLSSTIEVSVSVCYTATVLVIWLVLCRSQNMMVQILHDITKVDSSLVYLSGGRDPESSWCYFLILYLSSIVLCTIISVTDNYCYDPPTIIFINSSIPIVTVYWFIIQYVSVLKLIENRFRALCHAFLNRLVSSNRQTINPAILEDISFDKNHYPKIITFRRTHTVLYELACKVSELYSLPILLAIAVSSASIVYNAYFLIMPLFATHSGSDMICTSVNAVFSITGISLPITMLTAGVNRTLAEMRNIADATHKLLERSTISQEDKVELQQFSLKLLLPNDQFTAYRLFSLDGTLLHSIFSMVVTYLVILCQLQLSTQKKSTVDNSTNAPN